MMDDDDNINELNELFDDSDNKVNETTEIEEPIKEDHPLGEKDWVERRKNPYGRRKEDKDRLLATRILLAMTIIMIVITAGILGIELELKKELEDSIKSTSYEYSVQKFETNQKKMKEEEEEKKEEKEEEATEENKVTE